MVDGSWCMFHGSWVEDWFMAHGYWILVLVIRNCVWVLVSGERLFGDEYLDSKFCAICHVLTLNS